MGSLSEIPMHKQGISRSCSYENPSGEKGKAGMAASPLGPGRKGAPFLKNLLVGSTAVLADIDGPGVLKHFFITVTDDGGEDSTVHRDLLFRIYWEGETEPAVECPLGDFFCCGEGQINNDIPLPVTVVPARGLHCYFPMPFRKHIKITLENRYKETIFIVAWQADFLLDTHFTDEIAYFHAAWNQISFFPGQAVCREIKEVSGKGHYVGGYLCSERKKKRLWKTAVIKLYPDSAGSPICDRRETGSDAGDFGFVRWRISDPILFERHLWIVIDCLEIEAEENISFTGFWYQSNP